jgi:hypothetical protein
MEVGHNLELSPALATRERVGMEDLRDQARPAPATAALLGWLRFDSGLSRRLQGAISAHTGIPERDSDGSKLRGWAVSSRITPQG